MKAITLQAQIREVTGKKVKKLRKEGLLPVSVYGKDVKSVALSVPIKEFLKVYGQAGETGLVEMKFDGKGEHTLISNVQIHPVSRLPLHAEFHAVNLKEKIKANVPVELIGQSPAVQNNVGVLLQTVNEIEVEALPTDLPDKIEVDVTKLAEIDQQVTVGELPVPTGVEVLTAKEEIVVKVAPAVSEETKKELEAAAAAAEAAKAEAPVVTGEGAPAVGRETKPSGEAPAKTEEKTEAK